MKKEELVQGSKDWLALRRGRITATKAAILMGLSIYQTPYGLWEEELGLREPQECKPHMQRGLDVEDDARAYFLGMHGIDMKPAVVLHPDNDKFMASLDGLSSCGNYILEIKNNNRDFHEMARCDKVINFHVAQVQWQMYCAGVSEAYYLSYRPGDEVVVKILRDEKAIGVMVEQANKFLAMVGELTPPPLTDKDYIDLRGDGVLAALSSQYAYSLGQQKYYKDNSEKLKEEIIARCHERCSIGPGFRLSKYAVKGRVDYDAIMQQHNIDVEPFRKENSISYRITLE